ncbi:MAG: hypothetical protein ACFUZC_09765 [Chthoniobacteraceae bacterium]
MIIDFYVFCMGLGFLGLLLMAVMGVGHHGGGGHGHTGGHDLHGGHFHLDGHGHAHAPAHHADLASHEAGPGAPALNWLSYLAPRVWFSMIFGFGAAGAILDRWISGLLLIGASIAVAWVFERGLVRPVWNFVLQFASTPARTLETAMLEEAVAETNFDAEGAGLVSLTLDGQVHQMLGMLQAGSGPVPRILSGERLIIVGIDPHRNRCTVARRGNLS